MSRRIGLFWLLAVLVLPVRAGTVEYIHTDGLGTPVAVTDANRNVIERSEYEPYGQVINRPLRDGPGYTGHVEDAATGLAQMQQRYYDPQIGRFLSVDPVTADGSTGANFNRYKYAANNPYRFTDPDGRMDRETRKEIAADRKAGSGSVLAKSPGAGALMATSARSSTGGGTPNAGGRSPGTIYVTGHSVGKVGPTHLAVEYTDKTGPHWISAGPEDEKLKSGQDLQRPTDKPELNQTIGQVKPPAGMTAGAYFSRLQQADLNYCDCLDYDLFPGIMNSYNSNSYVQGLIQATGGSTSVGLGDYFGAPKPVPPSYFRP